MFLRVRLNRMSSPGMNEHDGVHQSETSPVTEKLEEARDKQRDVLFEFGIFNHQCDLHVLGSRQCVSAGKENNYTIDRKHKERKLITC